MPSSTLDPDSIVLIIGGLAVLLLCLSIVPSLVSDHRTTHSSLDIPLSDLGVTSPEQPNQLLHSDPFRREVPLLVVTSSPQQAPGAARADVPGPGASHV